MRQVVDIQVPITSPLSSALLSSIPLLSFLSSSLYPAIGVAGWQEEWPSASQPTQHLHTGGDKCIPTKNKMGISRCPTHYLSGSLLPGASPHSAGVACGVMLDVPSWLRDGSGGGRAAGSSKLGHKIEKISSQDLTQAAPKEAPSSGNHPPFLPRRNN
ncbi:hypothetical protein E2C01_013524 [Portunus trituberculatus]|uniref:Uncharacterized protein n=1 Tax=Portunus trituberculatus TaxID=210409 RepID=A0A5B7DGH2_PORTR|nr:hypothetical protein [Portunus trituberculatus]